MAHMTGHSERRWVKLSRYGFAPLDTCTRARSLHRSQARMLGVVKRKIPRALGVYTASSQFLALPLSTLSISGTVNVQSATTRDSASSRNSTNTTPVAIFILRGRNSPPGVQNEKALGKPTPGANRERCFTEDRRGATAQEAETALIRSQIAKFCFFVFLSGCLFLFF